ncbi:FtsH protease activity modulator HflK [soil metagenome]
MSRDTIEVLSETTQPRLDAGIVVSSEPPRRPNDGPPDLEEAWREFNRKLGGLFGKPSRGAPRPPSGGNGMPGRGARFGFGIVVAIAALLWLGSGAYIVPEGQQAVTLTFGKLSGVSSTAGLKWRLPYPIQSSELVNISELRSVEIGYRGNSRTKMLQESLMLTDDEPSNIVDLQFAVSWRIRDDGAADFLFRNRAPDENVRQAAETSMREVVGRMKMDSVLSESRTQVVTEVQKNMQAILDRYHTGILVSSVAIQQVQPPEQVQAAFEDANRAQQDSERQINEGQAYANDVIPKARGAASRLMQEAEGYRARVVDSAEGDASRFVAVLAEYNRAPAVTRERMYIDTMQQVYQNASKVLIDSKSSSPLLYLPLEQLIKQNAADAAAATRAPTPPSPQLNSGSSNPPPPSAVTDVDRREALRNRDVR